MHINKFILKYKKYFLSDRRYEKGDLDILDNNKKIRSSFDYYLKNKKFIISKRYHKTGLRYDIIDSDLKIYSFDFLNGKEKNPFKFNFSRTKLMKKTDKINFKFNLQNINKLIKNIINQIRWRLFSILNQNITIIELFGVDGSGKSYFAKKIVKNIKNIIKFEVFHLWRANKINNVAVIPYNQQNYKIFLSYLKELYLVIKVLIFYLKNIFFDKRKKIIIFDRSLRDIVVDPTRYRLSHYPLLINILLNFILKNSYIFYLDITYKLSKKRKGEINRKTYKRIRKNIKKYLVKNITFLNKKQIFILKNKKWLPIKN